MHWMDVEPETQKLRKKQAKAWSWVRGVSNHERKGRMNGFLGKEMNGAKTKE